MALLNDYPVAGVVRVEDLGRAKRYYTETLGLTEVEPMGIGGTLLRAGGGSQVMLYERPGMPAPENTTLSFAVSIDAFDDVITQLRDNGVVFEDYDLPDQGIQTSHGVAEMEGGKAAWFKDSEGNIINIGTPQGR